MLFISANIIHSFHPSFKFFICNFATKQIDKSNHHEENSTITNLHYNRSHQCPLTVVADSIAGSQAWRKMVVAGISRGQERPEMEPGPIPQGRHRSRRDHPHLRGTGE
jgi:hypothetical protein